MHTFRLRTAWFLLLLTAALAGCADEPLDDLAAELPLDAVASDDGRDLRDALTIDDALPGPDWGVGDWFGHHVFFGPDDVEGTHMNVVVTDQTSNAWHLVSEDAEIAQAEALFDIPITGDLVRGDLDTTAFGGDWQVYDFPMRHNKTWQGTITLGVDQAYDLTYTATYQPEFQTAGGNKPGFLVTGVDPDGRTVIETDYVPALGWYSRFTAWNVETEDTEDFVFRSVSMGTGHDWTGDYLEYDAEPLLDVFQMVQPDPSTSAPAYADTFAVGEATHVAGVLFSFAVAGASELRLVDPAGTVQVQQSNTDIPGGADPDSWTGTGQGDLYVLDATPGDWRLLWQGPGFVSGFGAQLWTLTEAPGTLVPEPA